MVLKKNQYNLIIYYSSEAKEWEVNPLGSIHYTYDASRIPTDTSNGAILSSDKLNDLKDLPCLFGYEDFGGCGRLGEITKIRKKEDRYSYKCHSLEIEYKIDKTIAPIPLRRYYEELGLGKRDIIKSRWTVRTGDLYKAVIHELSKQRKEDFLRNEEMIDIWGKDYNGKCLVFLSHRDNFKREVSKIKEGLEKGGDVKCFLAHDDINPGSDWEKEIMKAMNTAHLFVAVITKDFHEGIWTNQEVGYALRKDIPILPWKIGGDDPKGFLASVQALKGKWEDASSEILNEIKKLIDRRVLPGYKTGQ